MKKILFTAKARLLKLGFTYVELLVVITIITLLSSTSAFYFSDFFKSTELSQKLNTIENNFNDLDKKIKDYSIFDYEIQLNTSSGGLGYIEYVNNFDIPFNQYINLNSSNGSGTLSTNGNIGQTWNIKIYKRLKLYLSENIQSNQIINFDFNNEPNFKIIGTVNGEILNEININYFTEDNIYPEKNNLLILTDINTKEDKLGTSFTNISIKNIGGNKTILGDGININEAYLFFDNNGKQKFIKIKK